MDVVEDSDQNLDCIYQLEHFGRGGGNGISTKFPVNLMQPIQGVFDIRAFLGC